MKTLLILFACCGLSLSCYSQTKNIKNNFSAAFGFQQYNGDLGNTFFATDEEWYGVARLAYSRYLNPSFDAMFSLTSGDFGHCYEGSRYDPIPSELKLNLRSRLTTATLTVKYKFANDYLLKEEAKFTPYVYAGGGINNMRDTWSAAGDRVNKGNYWSINAGAGVGYNLTQNIQLVYNLGLGYFVSDKLDYISQGSNDMYLQNTLSLGINLF